MHVDCVNAETNTSVGASDISRDFDVDLQYSAAGGVHYVYSDHPVNCTLTEPVNGGASSVTINPTSVLFEDNAAFTATVTNVFPATEPVALQPTFTG